MRHLKSSLLTYLLVFLFLPSLHPHSGSTDSSGGHNCSTQSRAKGLCVDYHYHNGKSPLQKYHRSNWEHWIDRDGDCQDERAEILISYSEIPVKFKSSKGCVVDSGQWVGPYTGNLYYKATDLDIDHIVPLKEAYLSGGKDWSKDQKREFSNDHENLLPVDKSTNRRKGSKDPTHWLPIDSFVCEYIEKWQSIKKKYNLTMDPLERNRILDLEKECKDQEEIRVEIF